MSFPSYAQLLCTVAEVLVVTFVNADVTTDVVTDVSLSFALAFSEQCNIHNKSRLD